MFELNLSDSGFAVRQVLVAIIFLWGPIGLGALGLFAWATPWWWLRNLLAGFSGLASFLGLFGLFLIDGWLLRLGMLALVITFFTTAMIRYVPSEERRAHRRPRSPTSE